MSVVRVCHMTSVHPRSDTRIFVKECRSLVRAGYEHSAQVEDAMRWLLSMRQDDGGWAIPARTLGMSLNVMYTARETVEHEDFHLHRAVGCRDAVEIA